MTKTAKRIDRKINALVGDVELGWRKQDHIKNDLERLCGQIRAHDYILGEHQAKKTSDLIETLYPDPLYTFEKPNMFAIYSSVSPKVVNNALSKFLDEQIEIVAAKIAPEEKEKHAALFGVIDTALYQIINGKESPGIKGTDFTTIKDVFALANNVISDEPKGMHIRDVLALQKKAPAVVKLPCLYPQAFNEGHFFKNYINPKLLTENTLSVDGRTFTGTMMGSRNDFPLATKEDENIIYHVGCFHSNKRQFLKAIEFTHGDNQHGRDYRKFILETEEAFGVAAPERLDALTLRI